MAFSCNFLKSLLGSTVEADSVLLFNAKTLLETIGSLVHDPLISQAFKIRLRWQNICHSLLAAYLQLQR